MTFYEVSRGYDFEPTACRWLDRWSRGTETVTQSLRCYSPADLTLLLEGTGLRLDGVEPGPGPTDTNGSGWQDTAPLHLAMAYTAVLRADSEH